jgi:hypothetical protein
LAECRFGGGLGRRGLKCACGEGGLLLLLHGRGCVEIVKATAARRGEGRVRRRTKLVVVKVEG